MGCDALTIVVYAHTNFDETVDEIGCDSNRRGCLSQLHVAPQHLFEQHSDLHARKERAQAKMRAPATK